MDIKCTFQIDCIIESRNLNPANSHTVVPHHDVKLVKLINLCKCNIVMSNNIVRSSGIEIPRFDYARTKMIGSTIKV
jgi:hypothetical protein